MSMRQRARPRVKLAGTPAQWLSGSARASLNGAADATPLSWGDRLNIIDALAQVLDGVYAHLPLKRSLYGFDVIRGLEHLRQQLHLMTDLQFHRELTALMNRLRDAHTQYQGPWTVKGAVEIGRASCRERV